MTEPLVIHLIDDDEPVRTAFIFALRAVGYHAIGYADADEFIATGLENGIIVSDVRMPGTNGAELARGLRGRGSTVPIILMTGHAGAEVQAEAASVGADLVLAKPVALSLLVAEIERLAPAESRR